MNPYEKYGVDFVDLSHGSTNTFDIRFISDTHCKHEQLTEFRVDAIIHCGDEASSRDVGINANQSREFIVWYTKQWTNMDCKLLIPGNHSKGIEAGMIRQSRLGGRGITILIDQPFELYGYKIFGSPWTPRFGESWAYMEKRNRMDQIWKQVPDDTDILVTHGPPKGILDLALDYEGDGKSIVQAGCKSLYNRVREIKPIIHAFGHLHESLNEHHNYGTLIRNDTCFINASCCELHGDLINPGVVVRLPKRKATDVG